MEYQKVAKFLDVHRINHLNLEQGNWIEINDESRGTYTSNDIKFKTTMLGSDLCEYADA